MRDAKASAVQSYRDLIVWQLAMDVAKRVYQASNALPKSELYGLANQLRRSAVSVPSNIAEGHARESSKEFLHHISFAMGSLAELETQILLAESLQYLSHQQVSALLNATDDLGRKLRGLQKSIKAKVT